MRSRPIFFSRTLAALTLSALALAACSSPMPTDGGTVCEPSCRPGFACLHGSCVSACNPACAAGETCTADLHCVASTDAGFDASDVVNDVVFDSGSDSTSPGDVSDATTDASTDASHDAGGPVCASGMVACGGTCRTPTLPPVGRITVTNGTYGVDQVRGGSFAIDPCTGEIGFAYIRQQSTNTQNWELYFEVLTASGAVRGPTRVTNAPGPAFETDVVFTGDRYVVFFTDQRNDPAPEACTSRCLDELYVVALDRMATVLAPESRLTTHGATFPAGYASEPRVVFDPGSNTIGVVWEDSRGNGQVYCAAVRPDGSEVFEQQLSNAPSPDRGNSARIRWDGTHWLSLFRYDDPDGARPDYVYARTFAPDGTLGAEHGLMYANEEIEFVVRPAGGYSTLAAAGSGPPTFRFFDASWGLTTTLMQTASAFDGTWGFEFDGTSYWLTNERYPAFELDRYNSLGVANGSIQLAPDATSSLAEEVRIAPVGDLFVVSWVAGTTGGGSVVHQYIDVVDGTTAH